MSSKDQETLLRSLRESAQKVALDDRWALAAGSQWSPTEIVEHLVLTEESVLRIVRGPLLRTPEVEPNTEADEMILGRVPDRGGAAVRQQAPDRTRPTGKYASAEEAVAAFQAARENTVEWASSADPEQLRRHRLMHPALGELDGVQWLLFLAAHTERHVRQIKEILATNSSVANA